MMRLAAVLVLVGSVAIAGEAPIVGRASVIDGDTIDVHGIRVRFQGIDAPESWQTCEDRAGAVYRCGKVAAAALDAFLAEARPIRCEPAGRGHERQSAGLPRCRVSASLAGRG